MLHIKYFPKRNSDCIFHKSLIEKLENYGKFNNLLNTIIYGPEGSGKKTICYFLLSNLLGTSISDLLNINISEEVFKDQKYTLISNNYFFEIDAMEIKYSDKKILTNFILQIAETFDVCTFKYKILIISNAQYISHDMQFSLRYLIDTCINNLRIIFITTNLDRMDDTIQSRCCLLNVPNNPSELIENWVQSIAKKENIEISKDEVVKIIQNSNKNLNKILICLYGLKCGIMIPIVHKSIVDEIIRIAHKKNTKIHEIREIAYFIASFDIKFDDILENLAEYYITKLPVEEHLELVNILTINSTEIQNSSRQSINYEKMIVDLACFLKSI